MTIISVKIDLSKLVTRTWGSAPPPFTSYMAMGESLIISTQIIVLHAKTLGKANE